MPQIVSKQQKKIQDSCVINDPLGQAHSLAKILFSLEFCFVLKSGDGRTDEQTTC